MFVSYTFEIDDKIKDKIERIADEAHRSLAGQVRQILEEYIERHK
jgi:predicted transcriptional regulator